MDCTDKSHVKINKSSKQHVKLYELFKKKSENRRILCKTHVKINELCKKKKKKVNKNRNTCNTGEKPG